MLMTNIIDRVSSMSDPKAVPHTPYEQTYNNGTISIPNSKIEQSAELKSIVIPDGKTTRSYNFSTKLVPTAKQALSYTLTTDPIPEASQSETYHRLVKAVTPDKKNESGLNISRTTSDVTDELKGSRVKWDLPNNFDTDSKLVASLKNRTPDSVKAELASNQAKSRIGDNPNQTDLDSKLNQHRSRTAVLAELKSDIVKYDLPNNIDSDPQLGALKSRTLADVKSELLSSSIKHTLTNMQSTSGGLNPSINTRSRDDIMYELANGGKRFTLEDKYDNDFVK